MGPDAALAPSSPNFTECSRVAVSMQAAIKKQLRFNKRSAHKSRWLTRLTVLAMSNNLLFLCSHFAVSIIHGWRHLNQILLLSLSITLKCQRYFAVSDKLSRLASYVFPQQEKLYFVGTLRFVASLTTTENKNKSKTQKQYPCSSLRLRPTRRLTSVEIKHKLITDLDDLSFI